MSADPSAEPTPDHVVAAATARVPGWVPGRVWRRAAALPPGLRAAAGYWACTRLLMVAMLFSSRANANGEMHTLYERWSRSLAAGSFPLGDPTWQYPPGAALVMLAPRLVPAANYVQGFVVVAFLADLAVLAALLAAGSAPGRSPAGAWAWVLGLPMMLYLPYARYDMVVTAFAVLGLLALRRRPGLAGGLAAVGALMKVWPAFAVLGVPRRGGLRRAAAGFAVSAVGLTVLPAMLFDGPFDFLRAQQHRGIEFESLAGAGLLLARFAGYPGTIRYQYGSMEFAGPYVSQLAVLMLVAAVLGLGWLLLWRVRAGRWTDAVPADAALTAVLVFVTTSRVISPQYFVWLIGLSAVCLTRPGTTQRPVVGLLACATALTTVEYPLFFDQAVQGSLGLPLVVVVRNLVLLAATVLSCRRLWRATVPPRRPRGAAAEAPAPV